MRPGFDLPRGPDGQPLPFMDAVVGGRAVGVPGTVRMLEAAHRLHGKLPWATLFQPAIGLAEQGFRISPRLHTQLKAETALRRGSPAALWPEAKSVVVLAMNYGPDENPLDILSRRDRAAISVYAKNRDYHDLVKARLKRFAASAIGLVETGLAILANANVYLEGEARF